MNYIFVIAMFLISQVLTMHEVVKYSHTQNEHITSIQDPLFTPEQMAKAKDVIKSTKKKDVNVVDAANIFKKNCQSCHGRKGGLGLANAANLKKSIYTLEERVAMVYYGRKTMQAYSPGLSNAEIIAVSTYLETLRK